jgi:hypothetical protein
MDFQRRVRLLRQFSILDDDSDMLISLYLLWRQNMSHLRLWLLRTRITLQRIVAERRTGIENYFVNVLPRYHNEQFREHFRMTRATFEVLTPFFMYVIRLLLTY